MIKTIAVLGGGSCASNSVEYLMARKFAGQCGKAGISIIHGGYGGIMTAISEQMQVENVDGKGIVMGIKPKGNQYLPKEKTLIIQGETLEKQFGIRLGLLLSADALVFFPGESGTLVELCTALHLQKVAEKFDITPKKIVILEQEGDDNYDNIICSLEMLGFAVGNITRMYTVEDTIAYLQQIL